MSIEENKKERYNKDENFIKGDVQMNNEKVFWGFHNNNEEIKMIEGNYIALGWNEMGNLLQLNNNREAYYKQYEKVYPQNKKASITISAGQLFRFVNEAKIGDYIVFPTKYNGKVNIGVLEGTYYFDENERNFPHKRNVQWIKKGIDRNDYSQGAKYEFGSYLSFFSIKNFYFEHIQILEGKKIKRTFEDDDTDLVSIDTIIENTKDYIINELSRNFKGYEFEKVVSDLLNAMGYKTKNSPHGGDHGKDIIVYRDELPPRIVVQVKSQDGDVTEATVQSLKGALNPEDYGLFITLSDFTKNAKEFLSHQSQIKSINGSEFVDLLLKYYEKMPEDFKNIISLEKVYIPNPDDKSEE